MIEPVLCVRVVRRDLSPELFVGCLFEVILVVPDLKRTASPLNPDKNLRLCVPTVAESTKPEDEVIPLLGVTLEYGVAGDPQAVLLEEFMLHLNKA